MRCKRISNLAERRAERFAAMYPPADYDKTRRLPAKDSAMAWWVIGTTFALGAFLGFVVGVWV